MFTNAVGRWQLLMLGDNADFINQVEQVDTWPLSNEYRMRQEGTVKFYNWENILLGIMTQSFSLSISAR